MIKLKLILNIFIAFPPDIFLCSKIKLHIKVLKEKGLDAFIVSNPFSKRYLLGTDNITNYIVVTKNRIYVFKPFDKSKENYSNNDYNNNNFTEFILYKRNELKIELNKVIEEANLNIIGFESNLTYSNWLKLKFYFGKDIVLVPCDYLIEDLRAIKTTREIKIIKEASEITEQLLKGFFANKIPYGTTEIELEKDFEKYIFKNNIERLPFRFEVSTGKKTSLVNSTPSNNVIKPDDLRINPRILDNITPNLAFS
ncbi:M24 family metallopeptidase [Fervidibacillus albus]|uniref:Aminopeptidase P family N-terminal domain-containing protein n=1 Tax=Fervidibacillus albus TaxID=2980026 RepID=A0A9E8LTC6_9BACI|nr:aminopeptidase P family N-terminal domain-containing protein [Fervidibacillus albus]WAA09171.1 aminopeptidase P family N-terminal domain-containing protein [Fervidibacillus albus]